ncbi:structure-specific endonuclease subunit SLX1 [Fukomys damarensis]|uniref:structure-specific endonuclease subunit SLX1 n=1 Tax=Fukomys damarensis TaxID=885580 RepID=UPI00145506BE|nr:structure-specific endonuclease subunit SLX1 [Fukomys damarensis]
MGPAGGAARPGRFFGVYLLYCLNPRHRGRVYVGFTVNPARRVQQHNGGRKKGGAWRTSGRGPWACRSAALSRAEVPTRHLPRRSKVESPMHAFLALCHRPQDEEGPLRCPHPGCPLRAHVICLAEEFLRAEPGQLVPLEGRCPGCRNSLLWGDLISLCGMGSEEGDEDSDLAEAHWTDLLAT